VLWHITQVSSVVPTLLIEAKIQGVEPHADVDILKDLSTGDFPGSLFQDEPILQIS